MFINQYVEAATEKGWCDINGDHKRGNKLYSQLKKLYTSLESDNDLALKVLPELLSNKNSSVRNWAASHSLGLGLLIDDSKKVLLSISQNDPEPIIRHNADMTLSVWKEQGYLKF